MKGLVRIIVNLVDLIRKYQIYLLIYLFIALIMHLS